MVQPQMDTDEHGLNEITFSVNGCAMDVINQVGHGFHEKIYENALALALKKRGLNFSQQKHFDVYFDTEKVGSFVPDFVVENNVIVELKTIDRITNNEKGQVMNYLRVSGLKIGIILNFKYAKLDWARVIL